MHVKELLSLKDKIVLITGGEGKYGRLDVLVNCAVARPMKGYKTPLEQWQQSMGVNATGLFDITREMADLMASQASAYINGENILMDGGMHA